MGPKHTDKGKFIDVEGWQTVVSKKNRGKEIVTHNGEERPNVMNEPVEPNILKSSKLKGQDRTDTKNCRG